MDFKNSYYIKRVLKENIYYIVAFIVVVLLFIFIGVTFTNEYTSNSAKISQSKDEVNKLLKRKKILDTLVSSNSQEVKKFNLALNSLIPDNEDFFSIIYALERLSKKTNFIITNYGIDLAQTTGERMTLSILGDGDTNAFLKFLENYNFASGRLITMNDYDFTNKGVQFKVTLNLYNKKVSPESVNLLKLKEEDMRMMRDIVKKLDFLFINSPSQDQLQPSKENFDYKTTQELF